MWKLQKFTFTYFWQKFRESKVLLNKLLHCGVEKNREIHCYGNFFRQINLEQSSLSKVTLTEFLL